MSYDATKNRVVREERGWVRRNIIPILALFFAVAISVTVFVVWRFYPGQFEALKKFGYLGAFLISLLFNATIILPAGNVFALAALGAILPYPILVGVAAGAGAVIGECTGYMAGYSGRKAAERSRLYERIEFWMQHWGSLTIFILSMFPLFFDVAGLAAGIMRYPFKKFILWCWLGRTIFYIAVAYAGYFGWEALLRFLARA